MRQKILEELELGRGVFYDTYKKQALLTWASSDSCAGIKVNLLRSYSSTFAWPRLTPGQASTMFDASAQRDEAGVVPDGVDAVQQMQAREPVHVVHVDALCQDPTTTRSRRRRTALTSLRKLSSPPMHRLWWSSQIITLRTAKYTRRR